ncbi:phage tail sheath family protein [Kamptonema formosum]|uniref:phage tail sheath family protein n=1 Tax=Kamptonema formosum TaxID=331992 RepID=UPI0003466A34|nr:phage tail sheath subtilisin-like domain-containing protein [Oscillatoria sp. PCC 10802]
MVSQQIIPGVYKEEIFPAPALELIAGVPAFLGFAEKGPVNEAQRLTLWPKFAETFGQPSREGYLYRAVEGFFSNGGRLCYVVRLQEENISPKEALSNALKELESLDAVDLICAPEIVAGNPEIALVQQMQGDIVKHCDERMGDRFAILDSPSFSPGAEIAKEILKHRQNLRSPNAALYFPWIKIETGSYIPPCGHIAGVYARCDREVGPHKAPANYVLEGVLDLQFEVSDTDFAKLNPESEVAGVNVVRAFRGRGIRIWGARTLSSDPVWRYINVRRLFLTAGRWIERNLADVAFEPNDYKLWVRIERELTAYFQSLFQGGALKGSTPQEGFYVKCDEETNPPEVRDAGKVVTEIGLAPTIPNEFIVVRLIHGTTGVSLTQTTSSP